MNLRARSDQTDGGIVANATNRRLPRRFVPALMFSPALSASAATAAAAAQGSFSSWFPAIASAVIVGAVMYLLGRRMRPANDDHIWRRLMVEEGSDAMGLLDASGRIIYVNPAMEATTGFTQAELLAMNIAELDAAHSSEDTAQLLSAQAIGSSVLLRTQCRHRNGGEIPVEVNLHTFRHNGLRRHAGVLRNIAAQTNAEAELRASQERYRLLLDNTSDALYLHDETGQLVDVNERSCLELGYRRDELLAMNVSDIDVDFPKGLARSIWDTMVDDDPYNLYGRHRRKDGSAFPVEVHVRAFRTDDRRLFLALARDITERKEAERALRESEERFQAFMDESPVVAWIKDDAYCYRYVNSSFETLFDRPKADIVDREDFDIYPEQFAKVTRADDARVRENNAVSEFVEVVPGADGIERSWLVHKFPLPQSDGSIWVAGTAIDITDRLKAEKAARLSAFGLDNAASCFYLLDQDARFLQVNHASCDLLGYTNEELTQLSAFDININESREAWPHHWRELREKRKLIFETEMKAKDGRTIPVEINANYMEFEGTAYNFAFVRDLTRQKQAESALAASESQLRAIVDSEPECVKLLSHDNVLLDMNPAGLRMVEADRAEEVIGQDVTQLVSDPYREAFATVNQQAFEGRSGILEFQLTGLKGTRRWMETHVSPLRDREGNVTAALSVTRDITDRKRDEELLMKLLEGTATTSGDAFFQALIQALAESLDVNYAFVGEIVDHGPDGSGPLVATLCTWIGGQFSENFQYDLAGTPCANVLGSGLCLYENGVAEAFPKDTLLCSMQADSYLGAPLRTRDGEVIGILVVLDTRPMQRNQRTESIFRIFAERAGMELNRIQAQRSQHELEDELRQAQKLESIGTLAGGIAHDFNNILGAIIGNTDLALQDIGNEAEVRESIEEISKAANRARSLVNQILTFSRRERPSREVVDLGQVVHEATRMLRSMIPAAVEVSGVVAPNVPHVIADPDQMHQVIVNLCTNAWHATGEFEGHIKVALARMDVTDDMARNDPDLHAAPYVCLSVSDDGSGIEEEMLHRIFDPFFTTKGPGEGTGLGLAVVDGIIRDHDGKVRVSSKIGEGTTFNILLPAAEEAGHNPVEEPATPLVAADHNILYIDDEIALVRVAERALKRAGYRCTGYTEPGEALDRFMAAPGDFDAVISDFNMPGMTGLDLLREVRAIRPDVPVVLSSGNFTEQVTAVARELGIAELLFKPHSMKNLRECLGRVLTTDFPATADSKEATDETNTPD